MGILKKYLSQSDGFTLIEAIISVVIAALVIIPISMIFTGSLHRAVQAKDMLKANQLAQLYIENIKSKNETDLIYFFDNDPRDGNPGDTPESREIYPADGVVSNFPSVPNGFKVQLTYDKSIFTGSAYEISAPIAASAVDFVIDIPSASDKLFNVNYNSGINTSSNFGIVSIGTERIINIYYERNSTIDVEYKSSSTEAGTIIQSLTTDNTFTPTVGSVLHYAFRVNCLATDAPSVDTKIFIFNRTDNTVNCKIYENETNTVNPLVNDIASGSFEGPVTVETNLNDLSLNAADYKIYAVHVNVFKDNDLLTTVYSTKIDE